MSCWPMMLLTEAYPHRYANSPKDITFLSLERCFNQGERSLLKERSYVRSDQSSSSPIRIPIKIYNHPIYGHTHHMARYLVHNDEIRSTPTPTVLLSGLNSSSPLNLVRIGSASLRVLLISTKSIETTLRSWVSLRTMWTDSRSVSP
jgi:hypothetical protein